MAARTLQNAFPITGIVTRALVISVLLLFSGSLSEAVIPADQLCSHCHTMHYSQGGQQPAAWGNEGPYEGLVINGCFGCHSNWDDGENTVFFGGTPSPIVYNNVTPTSPLAAGNFYWVGPGGDDGMGHNVVEVQNEDNVLIEPPGAVHTDTVTTRQLTCAGNNGCHGKRDTSVRGGARAIKGAHHNNVDGILDNPQEVWSSYRFLDGVQGIENDGWLNSSSLSHNEYFGATTPMVITGCDSAKCHPAGELNVIRPSNETMSGFCATCHGNFHSEEGVGGATSPFLRHPTDVPLPNEPEYTAYSTYDINAPVARQNLISITDAVGAGDVVMCLSCHKAHASEYEKMMRWDYKGWPPGTGGINGCGVCHTSKN